MPYTRTCGATAATYNYSFGASATSSVQTNGTTTNTGGHFVTNCAAATYDGSIARSAAAYCSAPS